MSNTSKITIDRSDLTDAELRIIQRVRARREDLKAKRRENDHSKVCAAWTDEAEGKSPWLFRRRLIVLATKRGNNVHLQTFNAAGDEQFKVKVTDELVEQGRKALADADEKKQKAKAKREAKKAAEANEE